jgi:hypothetical protein
MACIHPGQCADCDACQPVCAAGPVHGQNAQFSGQPGSPGGAAKTGQLPCDTGWVTGR